jgi:hypothetical protein
LHLVYELFSSCFHLDTSGEEIGIVFDQVFKIGPFGTRVNTIWIGLTKYI